MDHFFGGGSGQAKHYDRSGQGLKRSNREQSAQLRSSKPSHKEELAKILAAIFESAKSRDALGTALAGLGLALYQRGRSVGVQTAGGRRYRLTTLGLAKEYTEAATRFELAESRLSSLQQSRAEYAPDHEREI